ncbi:MAG TPA: DUF554 domain-containing protein [Candidatus Limnocylindrales bacterium]|nr:DUF554 domain-containing protein [Candidatus Limnocylindrales bacterium]
MFLSGTILNVVAVLIGATIGTVASARIPTRVGSSLTTGIGLFVTALSLSMALTVFSDPTARTGDALVVLGSILLGVVLGEGLRIHDRLAALGRWFELRLARPGGESRVAEAFVTASLVFCVGPLTILGSLQNGLTGDATLLATKSLLDGVASVAFAAALGPGVFLAAGTVLVVQGLIAGGAFLVRDAFDPRTVLVLTATGGVILLGVALRLLELKDARVANFLPALVVAPILLRVADAIRTALGA